MITYSQTTLQKYLEVLAAREPVPGGGSAAAVSGALGASLIAMSARYALGKGKSPAVERRIHAIIAKADAARARFLALVSEDAEAYLACGKARKESPAAYRKALKKAAAVPREIVKLCLKTTALAPFLRKEGNPYLLSDVKAAEAFCEAGKKAAQIMIETNS